MARAWRKFQEDIEEALRRKPGNLGFYKNLNELMHHRMMEIGQVANNIHQFTLNKCSEER